MICCFLSLGQCGFTHRLLDSVEPSAAVPTPGQTRNIPPHILQSRLQPRNHCQQSIMGLTVHSNTRGSYKTSTLQSVKQVKMFHTCCLFKGQTEQNNNQTAALSVKWRGGRGGRSPDSSRKCWWRWDCSFLSPLNLLQNNEPNGPEVNKLWSFCESLNEMMMMMMKMKCCCTSVLAARLCSCNSSWSRRDAWLCCCDKSCCRVCRHTDREETHTPITLIKI